MCAPIIFLTSCSSGGGDSSPQNNRLLVGQWLQIELEADVRTYGEDNVTISSEPVVANLVDIVNLQGYASGYEVFEDGTYDYYHTSDGINIYLQFSGEWSSTSNRLTIDGEEIGTYTVNSEKFTISHANDNLGLEIIGGGFMDITNMKETYQKVEVDFKSVLQQ